MKRIERVLPSKIQQIVTRRNPVHTRTAGVTDEFITDCFQSEEEYDEYCLEFRESNIEDVIGENFAYYRDAIDDERGDWAGIGIESAMATYSLVRKYEPSTIIETGVCNGVSSLIILSALARNGNGTLYSIDYPMYADEPLPAFRETAYPDGHAFSAIPADKEPGWIVPRELENRWELHVGKSQRRLPEVLSTLDEIDVFLHDSEHTHPCMLFEYEIAWEWLGSNGILLSDDIDRNESFRIFTAVREPTSTGTVTEGVGYAIK